MPGQGLFYSAGDPTYREACGLLAGATLNGAGAGVNRNETATSMTWSGAPHRRASGSAGGRPGTLRPRAAPFYAVARKCGPGRSHKCVPEGKA